MDNQDLSQQHREFKASQAYMRLKDLTCKEAYEK